MRCQKQRFFLSRDSSQSLNSRWVGLLLGPAIIAVVIGALIVGIYLAVLRDFFGT